MPQYQSLPRHLYAEVAVGYYFSQQLIVSATQALFKFCAIMLGFL